MIKVYDNKANNVYNNNNQIAWHNRIRHANNTFQYSCVKVERLVGRTQTYDTEENSR